jgi:hypothetical protein
MNLRLDTNKLTPKICIEELQPVYYLNHTGQKEFGIISSWNDKYVFVKFRRSIDVLGWDGTTAQACKITEIKHYIGNDLIYPPGDQK